MKNSRLRKFFCLFAFAFLAMVGCSSNPPKPVEGDAIRVIKAPNVTSHYNENLAIDNQGRLQVKTSEGIQTIEITLSMIDQTNFNKSTILPQTLPIKYGQAHTDFTFSLIRPVTSMSVTKNPTVTSELEENLAIADDGVLNVNYADGVIDNVTITVDMIDTKFFNKFSSESQELDLYYMNKFTKVNICIGGNTTLIKYEAETSTFFGEGYVEDASNVSPDFLSYFLAHASAGASLSMKNATAGNYLAWSFEASKAGTLSMDMYINNCDDISFETLYTLKVNDEQVTVGQTGGSWDGSEAGAFFEFSKPVKKNINVKQGVNMVTLTLVNPVDPHTNIDKVDFKSEDIILTKKSIPTQTVKTFEAEYMTFKGLGSLLIETANTVDDDKRSVFMAKTSNLQSVSFVGAAVNSTISQYFTVDSKCNGTIAIYINNCDPLTFEDLFELSLNGTPITVGSTGGTWDGTLGGAYYEFTKPINVATSFNAGTNEFTLKVKDPSNCHTNFDRIKITAPGGIQ